jgi:hypothetical protein
MLEWYVRMSTPLALPSNLVFFTRVFLPFKVSHALPIINTTRIGRASVKKTDYF